MKTKGFITGFFKTRIQTYSNRSLLIIAGIFLLSSCASNFSLQKRRYTKGYYFSAQTKSKTNESLAVVKKSKIQAKTTNLTKASVEPKLHASPLNNQDRSALNVLQTDYKEHGYLEKSKTNKQFNASAVLKPLKDLNTVTTKQIKRVHKKDPMQGFLVGLGSTLGLLLLYYLVILLLSTFSASVIITLFLTIVLIIIGIVVAVQTR